jgi:hypothetical protein
VGLSALKIFLRYIIIIVIIVIVVVVSLGLHPDSWQVGVVVETYTL